MFPLKLIKELLCFVVVIVLSRVRTGDDHHNVVSTFNVQVFIADRRLEQVPMVFDPLGQIEGLGDWHEVKVQIPRWICTHFLREGQLTKATPAKIAVAHAAVHQPKSVV